MENGIGNEEFIINTFGEETKEWDEATKKADEMREELRIQFELNTSYEELRNQLEEWEGDKKWKAKEESNWRSNLEQILPKIPEEEEIGIFDDSVPRTLMISKHK